MGKKTQQQTPAMSVEEIIQLAVMAGRVAAEHTAKDTYKATERRLYAVPALRQKVEDDRERLAELRKYGPRGKSKSIVRFQSGGSRLSPEEIFEVIVLDMEATIAADTYELEIMEKALAYIQDDDYYVTVTGRYLEELPDEEVAEKIPCDTSTVWRNRKRLVQRISVLLYGAAAVK